METREEKITYIKRRMKELGLKPRTLSMKATGKPDTIRNLMRGNSKNWRQDTYEAIMRIIDYPEKSQLSSPLIKGFTQTELGLMSAIQAMIVILSNYDVIQQNDLKNVFSYQQKDFRMRAQSGAAEVMNQLIEFLNDQEPAERPRSVHTPLLPAQDQSKSGKS